MGVPKEAQAQQLGSQGCLGRDQVPLVLQLLSLTLSAGILEAVLVQVSGVPSLEEHELQQLEQERTYQELTQIKDGIDRLCCPCPWEWAFFQGHCYFFKSRKNWHDSITACQEAGAQLVVIKSAKEQSFLLLASKTKGYTRIGLSDLNKEGTWHWVDGSPLLHRHILGFWNPGEPNSAGEEACAEFKGDGWNDSRCSYEKYWICKKSATSCHSA
ncbi:CD209 antigen-like protein C [Ctenodactylus gundi]